jgi:hypothetical protein
MSLRERLAARRRATVDRWTVSDHERQRDEAIQRIATAMDLPRDVIDCAPRGAFHWTQAAPPGRCVYPLCDCPTSGPCQRL